MDVFYSFHQYFIWAWDYIASLSMWGFIKLFFFFFFLDFPRYLLVDIIVFIITIFRTQPKQFYGLEKNPPPLVSVIVPARNEEDTIGYTVKSLLESTYPRDRLEIIVIDDGSEDDTYEIALGYARRGNVQVFRKSSRGGKASCLQYGFQVAKGEFIVSVDSDTTFDRNAITNLLKPFNDPKVGAVSGNVKVRNRHYNFLTRLQYYEYMIGISMGRRFLAQMNMMTVVSGAFGCYRRNALTDTGAWDPGIGDDSNVTLKTRKLGYKIGFAPDAVVMTNAPTTIKKLFRQRRRWNRSFIRNRFRKHREVLNPFLFAPINLIAISISGLFRVVFLFTFLFFFTMSFFVHTKIFPVIVILGWMVYSMSSFISLLLSTLLSERRNDELKLLFFAPFIPFYRLFLRIPRLVAVTMEIFRIEYEDPFYPTHVWKEAPRW